MTDMSGYYRKVIKIKAEDSPNVRRAMELIERGIDPGNPMIIPGVLSWREYRKRRDTWDKIKQSVGLDAEFWLGSEILLYPPDWLNRAEGLDVTLRRRYTKRYMKRVPRGIGADTAEGGDKTAISLVDEYGLLDLISHQTPDTSVIAGRIMDLIRRHNIDPANVMFDRGGGGKQIADQLRSRGYQVRTVGFGEAVTLGVKKETARRSYAEQLEYREERYAYVNRRAEMYGELRRLLDPNDVFNLPLSLGLRCSVNTQESGEWNGFAIPARFRELRRQMSMMPLRYDSEGRMYMLSKNKKTTKGEKSLVDLIGCSPDEADSLVLAIHGLLHRQKRAKIGAMRSTRRRF